MHYLQDYFILLVLYIGCYFVLWRKQSRMKVVINTVFYLYLCIVFTYTLMPFEIPYPLTNPMFLQSANFIPFHDLLHNYGYAKTDIILNVSMTIPFGFIYPIANRKSVIQTITAAFLCSLFIEVMQLLYVWSNQSYFRTFDVTDIISNTCGALFGYLVYRIFRPVIEHLFSLHC